MNCRAAFVGLSFALTGCANAPLYRPIEKGPIAAGEVVVVGKIEIVPPLRPDEQHSEYWRGKAMLITSTEGTAPPEMYTYAESKRRIEVPLEKTFYVVGRARRFFVVETSIWMREMTTANPQGARALLPSGFLVEVKPGERAVYIGTLRYHRDEFFRIKRVEFVDEFEGESVRFAEKFGPYPELHQALMKPVEK